LENCGESSSIPDDPETESRRLVTGGPVSDPLGEISVDDLAAATKSSGCEVLSSLGRRFHRVYYAS